MIKDNGPPHQTPWEDFPGQELLYHMPETQITSANREGSGASNHGRAGPKSDLLLMPMGQITVRQRSGLATEIPGPEAGHGPKHPFVLLSWRQLMRCSSGLGRCAHTNVPSKVSFSLGKSQVLAKAVSVWEGSFFGICHHMRVAVFSLHEIHFEFKSVLGINISHTPRHHFKERKSWIRKVI
jgi:hypothetical protein